ncbi:hypothetical protein FF098_008265 [Parvularcula flava]|uniref:Uncharacterized protein n=2 Tax=Aquisalinus luteolus TaxID=1566827 RepID=A0ABX0HLJ9_9PROT|nr:hypothetical protein [Aquisalinus luteolus]NHK27893.1 hypothetical protein [Aquisalinus luteolus]
MMPRQRTEQFRNRKPSDHRRAFLARRLRREVKAVRALREQRAALRE